ncbi:MAG TPA: cytochrome P450, partial [Catenuloplanes sp.]
VGRALFGDDVDASVPALRRLVPLAGELVVARARQLTRPPLHWPTPRNRRLTRTRAEQYAIVDAILAGRPVGRADDERDDLLSRLRSARDPQTGQPLSEQEIRDQVLVFLLAGHETTAGALTFTLHLLGRHPDTQDEVAAAGAPAVGNNDLVRAAVSEGMRLFPSVHLMERLAGTDTQVGGYPVAAGTMVLTSPWVTHRHPDFWPEPDRFDPHRFVGDHDRPRYAYFPFGGGPRSCIGEHFAMVESTVLLRALLSRYRVTALDPGMNLQPLITLRPTTPVRAVLHRR